MKVNFIKGGFWVIIGLLFILIGGHILQLPANIGGLGVSFCLIMATIGFVGN